MKPEQKFKKIRWLILASFLLAFIIFQLNVSKPGTEIIACPSACSKTLAIDAQEPIRLLSFNMLHGFPDFNFLEQRTARLSQEIGRLNVDIVLLQEVPWTNQYGQIALQLAEAGDFNYAYYRANGNRALIGFEEGSVILSRYALQNLTSTELRPAAGIFENRVVLHALVITPQGPLDLFVTHLTNGRESVNARQTESLLAFVQNEAKNPAIVAGDFNVGEDTPQMVRLAHLWQDSYRLAYPNEPGPTCCASNLTNALITDLQERLDYLFLVPTTAHHLRTVTVERIFAEPVEVSRNGRLWLSDHAGLFVTLMIEPIP